MIYIKLHPETWQHNRPVSSTVAHVLIKIVQRVDNQNCEVLMKELRRAFFEISIEISNWENLKASLEVVGISVSEFRELIGNGIAFADLEADRRDQQSLMVQGGPTFILNVGYQKLYGNVGYGVLEANIKEFLSSSVADAASWC